MIRSLLIVGIGGFVGSAGRFGISLWLHKTIQNGFPVATLLANILGCLLIGLLYGLGHKYGWLGGRLWLLLATGFCGGFTTFSAFALENMTLLETKQISVSLFYAVLSLILGIIFCKAGMVAATKIF